MSEWYGPIPVKYLEKGIYRVSIIEDKFSQLPADRKKLLRDRMILIGRTSKRNLPLRIGEFLEAATRGKKIHYEGETFYKKREEHGLSVSDLEIEFKTCACPACEEIAAFEEFRRQTNQEKPYLCKMLPPSCYKHTRGIQPKQPR